MHGRYTGSNLSSLALEVARYLSEGASFLADIARTRDAQVKVEEALWQLRDHCGSTGRTLPASPRAPDSPKQACRTAPRRLISGGRNSTGPCVARCRSAPKLSKLEVAAQSQERQRPAVTAYGVVFATDWSAIQQMGCGAVGVIYFHLPPLEARGEIAAAVSSRLSVRVCLAEAHGALRELRRAKRNREIAGRRRSIDLRDTYSRARSRLFQSSLADRDPQRRNDRLGSSRRI